MHAELIFLRLIHVVGGVYWVGSVMFTSFFLMPTLLKAGPMVAGPVSAGLQARRLMTWSPVIALLVILSGLRLMMIASQGQAHWFEHRSGHAYAVAGLLAIIAFIVGMLITRPAMTKAAKLGQAAASDGASKQLIQDELKRLQRRGYRSTMTVTWLLILAAVGMAVARYL
jgi:uncharacterized membrane protein